MVTALVANPGWVTGKCPLCNKQIEYKQAKRISYSLTEKTKSIVYVHEDCTDLFFQIRPKKKQ